jgi:hypothetical protein
MAKPVVDGCREDAAHGRNLRAPTAGRVLLITSLPLPPIIQCPEF